MLVSNNSITFAVSRVITLEHNNEELRNTNGCYLFQHERRKLIETKTKLSENLMTDWGLFLR